MTDKELERIYNEGYRAVYWTAMQLLKNEADAEDVVQDTFVTLIESYDTIKDKDKVIPWLKKIAANKCLNRLTRTKTDAVEDEFFEYVEALPEDFLPDSIVESEEARKIVMDIISNSLSEDIRRTLVLFYFDEMSTKEIAEALAVPEGTVRRRLNFARNKIKKEVEKYEKDNKTKLFGMALPFLSKLFMKEAEQVPFKAMSAKLVSLSASAEASGKGVNIKASAEAIKKGTDIMKAKIIFGSIAAVVAVGAVVGIILGVMSKKADTKPDNTDDVVIEDIEDSQDTPAENIDSETDMSESGDVLEYDYSFYMLVTATSVVPGEGTLVTGDISPSGVLRVGDKVKIVDGSLVRGSMIRIDEDNLFETVEATVISIQKDSNYVDEISEGYDVVIMLDVEIEENIMYATRVITDRPEYNTKTIVANIYTEPRPEGKADPIFDHYNPNFRFGSETLKGYITLPSGVDLIFAGDYVEGISINLERDIDVEIGDEFDIIENGKVIGTGTVTGIK